METIYLQLSLQETTLRESFLSRDTYEDDLRKLEVNKKAMMFHSIRKCLCNV